MKRNAVAALAAATISALIPAGSQAAPLELIYTGAFGAGDAFGLTSAPGLAPFAGTTPFTVRATFDGAGPNLAAALPVPGFAAFAPERVTMTFGGVAYRVAGAAENPAAGVSVALFDPSNVFFAGRYGVGLIVDPLRDGAGIVGDWLSASPGYAVASPQPTVWQDYQGAGFSAGVGCVVGPPPCVVAPLELTDPAGQRYALQLGSRSEEFDQGAPLHTARLVAVPLPGTLVLALAGLAALGLLLRLSRYQPQESFNPTA